MQLCPSCQRLAIVIIGPPIGQRSIELIEQISVGTMDFDAVKPRSFRSQCCIHETVLDPFDILQSHCFRLHARIPNRDAAGTDGRQAGILGKRAGMIELREDRCTPRLHRGGQLSIRRDDSIVCHGELGVMRHAFRRHILMFHDDQGSGIRPLGIIGYEIVVRHTLNCLPGCHRRHHDPVAQHQPIDFDFVL